jgi:hypothetical protein
MYSRACQAIKLRVRPEQPPEHDEIRPRLRIQAHHYEGLE